MDLWEIRMGVIAHLGVNVTKTTTFSFYIFYFARQIKSEFGIFLGSFFTSRTLRLLKVTLFVMVVIFTEWLIEDLGARCLHPPSIFRF